VSSVLRGLRIITPLLNLELQCALEAEIKAWCTPGGTPFEGLTVVAFAMFPGLNSQAMVAAIRRADARILDNGGKGLGLGFETGVGCHSSPPLAQEAPRSC